MDTLSPWLARVLFCWAGKKTTAQPGSAWRQCPPKEETLTEPLYRLNLICGFPGSRGVISSLLELYISSLKCSRHGVAPLCSMHSICSPTLSFKPPIKRRPKIISEIRAVDLEQGEGLESPFSSPHPPFDAKEVFLLRFREPVLPALT